MFFFGGKCWIIQTNNNILWFIEISASKQRGQNYYQKGLIMNNFIWMFDVFKKYSSLYKLQNSIIRLQEKGMNEQLKMNELRQWQYLQSQDIFNKLKASLPDEKKTDSDIYEAAVKSVVQQYLSQQKSSFQINIYKYKPMPSHAIILKYILQTEKDIHLRITSSKLTHNFFQKLGSRNQIYSVSFIGCEVGDKYAKYLGQLNLDRIFWIRISSDRITNRGLKQLAKLKNAKRIKLQITNTDITTDGIKYQKCFYKKDFRKQLRQHKRMNEMLYLKSICYNQDTIGFGVYGLYFIQQSSDCLSIYLPHLAKIAIISSQIVIAQLPIGLIISHNVVIQLPVDTKQRKELHLLAKMQPSLEMLRRVASITTIQYRMF